MDENDEITLGQGCGHRITRGKGLSDGNDGASSRGEGLVQDEGESRIEARDRDISPEEETQPFSIEEETQPFVFEEETQPFVIVYR
ncbi:hypothetical protein JYU34_012866 [Plutella xylostella]|uniref:Uncharacterized protein n=1 Tax=Plutella xylostella TaxID=51655 RepID=A0ABQ7QCH1_PLUXY|nr:hypothetical protein JYU34_016557 [Plutella xylostella]KAG7302881.1 hypothetical protein JYU34_012866 [Plutella xylostella]